MRPPNQRNKTRTRLSDERRAQIIKDRLVAKGVDPLEAEAIAAGASPDNYDRPKGEWGTNANGEPRMKPGPTPLPPGVAVIEEIRVADAGPAIKENWFPDVVEHAGKGNIRLTENVINCFLAELMLNGGIVSRAATATGVSKLAFYLKRRQDPLFAKAWDEAICGPGTDVVEDEARRRAINGVEEPVFYQGDVCGYVTKYSDSLLVRVLAAHRTKYRDRSETSINNSNSVNVNVGIYLPKNDRDKPPLAQEIPEDS